MQVADMVAADSMMREGVTIIVRWTKPDRDPRQSGYRLDYPDELRRTKNPAELAVTGREIGDPDGATLLIGENGLHHGGVAQIFRLKIRHLVENDVGEPLLVIAGNEATENRIAVEARIAPPYETCRRIDQRGRAPIADHGKIKSVIGHEAASAPLREIRPRQWRTSAGRSKQAATPSTLRPTEMLKPS